MLRLKSKQYLRIFYGNLSNRSLFSVYLKSSKMAGNINQNLCVSLEQRLDVCLFRMNLVPTIFTSRQVLAHKKISVNGIIKTSPGFLINKGDFICVQPWENINFLWLRCFNPKKKFSKSLSRPSYVEINPKILCGVMLYVPKFMDVFYPSSVQFNHVTDFFKLF